MSGSRDAPATEVDLSALLRQVCDIRCQPFAAESSKEGNDGASAPASASRLETREFLQGLLGEGAVLDERSDSGTEGWRVRAAKALMKAGALAFADDEAHEQSPGWTAVHFAAELGDLALVETLVEGGGLWNAVDALGYTPGDVAFSLNHARVYRYLLDEGVRQTMLLNVLARHEAVEEDEEVGIQMHDPTTVGPGPAAEYSTTTEAGHAHVTLTPAGQEELANSNKDFLRSKLRFLTSDASGKPERCLDEDGNMVMAAWETDIMRSSAAALAAPHQPDEPDDEGWSVLNVGFGLGIVDRLLQSHKPKKHVIIEPHPDALRMMEQTGWLLPSVDGIRPPGPVDGTLASPKEGVVIVPSTWQDAVADPSGPLSDSAFAKAWGHLDENTGATTDADLPLEPAEVLGPLDAVYFDTYSEDYGALRAFFEKLPSLLAAGPHARFGFFHGLAATNAFLYDVMTAVVELDLRELGFKVHWHHMAPGVTAEDWQGVRREYWSLDEYRLADVRWDEDA